MRLVGVDGMRAVIIDDFKGFKPPIPSFFGKGHLGGFGAVGDFWF
jgi:hypothetical protein